MNREAHLNQAKVKAAKYCAGGEKAPFQVMQKLLQWELTEDEAQSVLSQLISENFISEERFVRAFCHDKFEFNHWGKIKIRLELSRFHISDQVITIGLNQIDPYQYEQVISQLGQKKWNVLKDDLWKRKQKTIAYLVQKGFEMDLCIEAVNTIAHPKHR